VNFKRLVNKNEIKPKIWGPPIPLGILPGSLDLPLGFGNKFELPSHLEYQPMYIYDLS
jgi:hypothetical protein